LILILVLNFSLNVLHFKFQFEDSEILEEQIFVAFGFTDFLTNVGGFLGLYLGCSFISVLEIFHFLLTFLHSKLKSRMNQFPPIKEGEVKNVGLSLADIFNV
jgi:hypothetical protein